MLSAKYVGSNQYQLKVLEAVSTNSRHCNLWKLCTTLHSADRNQPNILDNILFTTFIRRFIHVLHVVKIHFPLYFRYVCSLYSLCILMKFKQRFLEIQLKYLVSTNPCCFYYILLSTSPRANFPIWITILICGAASSRYQNCLGISYSPVKCIAPFQV